VSLTHVNIEVGRGRGPRHTVRFILDTGTVYSVLPLRVWHALALKPGGTMEFTLGDGTRVRRRFAECRFKYGGSEVSGPALLGERDDHAVCGTVTLERLGLVVHPFERTLRPMRLFSRLFKSARGGGSPPEASPEPSP
jgi:predicted aspartyl protease